MRTALVGAAIVVAATATTAATMPDTATSLTPPQPECEARMIEAVLRALPEEFRERGVAGAIAMDPRWAPLPGAEASVDVLLDEHGALRVQHAETIGSDVLAALEVRGLTPTLCEGGLDFACIGEFETVHLVFAKPAVDLEGSSIRVLMSGRTSPHSDRAYFEVWEYAFVVEADRAEVTGRTRVMQGHGRVPAF